MFNTNIAMESYGKWSMFDEFPSPVSSKAICAAFTRRSCGRHVCRTGAAMGISLSQCTELADEDPGMSSASFWTEGYAEKSGDIAICIQPSVEISGIWERTPNTKCFAQLLKLVMVSAVSHEHQPSSPRILQTSFGHSIFLF